MDIKDSNSKNNKSDFKKMNNDRKDQRNKELKNIVDSAENDRFSKEIIFKGSKKLKITDYLIVIGVAVFYIIITFLIDKYLISSERNWWEYFSTFAFGICLLVSLIIGWLRNKNTAKFYNDSRKRYGTTLDEKEGLNRRINKMFWLWTLIFLITSLIMWIV